MWLLFLLLLAVFNVAAAELAVTDGDGNEISVTVYPSDGELLLILLVDHDEERSMFEQMLRSINSSGIEIWRVDLLDAYFLPRNSESQRSLSGAGVSALLDAAHDLRQKTVLVAAYDRMPLALLRGVREWQKTERESRLCGAVLFYPNLFGPAPIAGEEPLLDPIVRATNIPLVIYQPDLGSQRWRIAQIAKTLWGGGAPAFVYLIPRVRDWFFMGDMDHGPGDKVATEKIPGQLHNFAKLMDTFAKPLKPVEKLEDRLQPGQIMELVEVNNGQRAPELNLPRLGSAESQGYSFDGRVTLVNFWATWCPPCVEEIPSLNGLLLKYQGKGFQVVSIDYRETEQQLLEFTRAVPVNFPILLDRDGLSAMQWKVFSFPSSFILDKEGRIRYSANLAIDWNSESAWEVIEKLLSE